MAKTPDDIAVEIEQLLGLPEETIVTEGTRRISLTIDQAQALLDKVS